MSEQQRPRWQRVETDGPTFRHMRLSRARTKKRYGWPYIEINRVPYQVRRIVADNIAWVTAIFRDETGVGHGTHGHVAGQDDRSVSDNL